MLMSQRDRLIRINKNAGPENLLPAIVEENRLSTRYRMDPEDVPVFEMSMENWNKIENSLYGTGVAVYDSNKKELRFLKYIGSYLAQKILSKIENEETKIELNRYINNINEKIRQNDESLKKYVADQVEQDKKTQSSINEDIEKVREHYDLKRTESRLIQAQKARPLRVFSDSEKARGLHWQAFNESDLQRSKKNLRSKKDAIKERIKVLEKQIRSLDASIKPHSEKINEAEAKLETDLDEQTFKDVRLSKEFNESQIEKLQNKLIPFFDQTNELHKRLEEIDNQLKILNLCISACQVKRDGLINHPRRVQRLRDRIYKHLRETEEIEDRRNGLNQEWRELTGDREDLVPILGLKSGSQMYFI